MKKLRKILMCGLWLCMLIPLFTQMSIRAEALVGMGTPENPYLVYTPADVLAIAQNPDGHYMLMADIDMSSVALFTPIGNETTGPFTGVLDGNGHTISGLFIYHPNAKASGFVAYNEGTIKNLIIDAEVCGGRYTGGIAAHNSGTVDNCAMKGEVYTHGVPMESAVGGIVGYNAGTVQNCVNYAEVTESTENKSNCGGIIGLNTSLNEIKKCVNFGNVIAEYLVNACGGIVGRITENKLIISECANYGCIQSTFKCTPTTCGNYNNNNIGRTGGIIGVFDVDLKATNCSNYGDIIACFNGTGSHGHNGYAGGFAGEQSSGKSEIVSFCNYGNVTTDFYNPLCFISGVLAYKHSSSYVKIEKSYNGGNLTGRNMVSATGFVGTSHGYHVTGNGVYITECLNSGQISGGRAAAFFQAISDGNGEAYAKGEILNCHNIGLINGFTYNAKFSHAETIRNCLNTGVFISEGSNSWTDWYEIEYNNSFTTNDSIYFPQAYTINKVMTEISEEQLKSTNMKKIWDFSIVWGINKNINGGLPYLRNFESLYFKTNKLRLKIDDSILLSSITDEKILSWESSDVSVVNINENIFIKGNKYGYATLRGIREDGSIITNIIEIKPTGSPEITLPLQINVGETKYVSVGGLSINNVSDQITQIDLSADSIALSTKITVGFHITGISPGTGFLTVTTASGATCTVPYTVTGNTTALTIPSTATVNRGGTTALAITRTPTASTTPIVWSTSDESIAKVDQNGVVTVSHSVRSPLPRKPKTVLLTRAVLRSRPPLKSWI